MKLMWLDKRRFKQCAYAQGIAYNKKVGFKEDCILVLRFIRSMQCRYFHYWSDGLELCNGELFGDIASGKFPIIRSSKLRNILNEDRLKFLINLGLLKRKDLDQEWVKLNRKCNTNAKYYYVFTDLGESLFNGDWKRIYKEESDYIDKQLGNRLPLLYRQIRDNLKLFDYDLPDKEILLPILRKHIWGKHRDTCISEERVEQLAEMFYQYAEAYSKLDESAIQYTVSTDIDRWAGRFYSHYSQINSILRNYIVLKEDPSDSLVQLDFKTFQMHCLVHSMKKDFGMKDLGLFERHLKNDFNRADVYKTLTMMHQVMDKDIKFVDGDEDIQQSRNDMKDKIFGAVYSRVNKSKPVWKAIESIYPEFAEGLIKMKTIPKTEFQKRMIIKNEDYKSNCYKQAPFMATFYEVKFFQPIWRHLIKQDIPFIPIHDAVLVPKSVADDVEDFMKDESTKFFGYELQIDREKMEGLQDD